MRKRGKSTKQANKSSILLVISIAFLVIIPIITSSKTKGKILSNHSNQSHLENFSNYEELVNFVNAGSEKMTLFGTGSPLIAGKQVKVQLNTDETRYNYSDRNFVSYQTSTNNDTPDHSTTNIQVKGVDEPDIIKNDEKFIYAVSNDEIYIINAYPAENNKISSEISPNGNPKEIFVNQDRLIVISRNKPDTYSNYEKKTFLEIYNITNRKNPEKIKQIKVTGNYFNSRMINNYAYFILTKPVRSENVKLPQINSNGKTEVVPASEVKHFNSIAPSYKFTIILGMNLRNSTLSREVYLMGRAQNLYVSRKNIYATYRKRTEPIIRKRVLNEIISLLPQSMRTSLKVTTNSESDSKKELSMIKNTLRDHLNSLNEEEKEKLREKVYKQTSKVREEVREKLERTIIHKISIKNGEIKYSAKGEVPGRVLNQFSMDEHEGFFRIATTTGHVSRTLGREAARNHVYILNKNLDIVGKLENLATGERIYSARFMGDKAYLVTFKKVDPLFALNLENPYNPKVLGKLKISGYSNYLHPYNENCLIGIGKSTTTAEGGNFAWYQGVKISLFDLSDMQNPKQISKFIIGDRGTESLALQEHKAFLFSRNKNTLVIPISLAEINENKYPNGVPSYTRGDYTWQGAYVLNVSAENGITLRGRVSHLKDNKNSFERNYYPFRSSTSIKRSLYIENSLYTFSQSKIKMNKLGNLKDINTIKLEQ